VVELEDGGIVTVKHHASAPRALTLSYTTQPGVMPQMFEDFEHINSNRRPVRGPVPEWMTALHQQLHLRLIHTQRLGAIGDQVPAVSTYSGEMAASINSLLASYARRSQELDSTFLERLLQQGKQPAPPLAEIHDRLKRIERKRAQLMELGFLDPEREAPKPLPPLDPNKVDVLSVYVEDTEGKLAVFDETARKVQLLTDAINKRFRYKRMSVSRNGGFLFRSSPDAALLPIDSLSSGEQHELVLFYELLFKVAPDTLVLVDEPEISLHLAWQQQFLGDLVEMVKLARFDVLVATHSPAIIGKHWDLTVELKGPDLEHAAQ
jgi:AAA domain, putative AbiEii toxin, Type IV TA system